MNPADMNTSAGVRSAVPVPGQKAPDLSLALVGEGTGNLDGQSPRAFIMVVAPAGLRLELLAVIAGRHRPLT